MLAVEQVRVRTEQLQRELVQADVELRPEDLDHRRLRARAHTLDELGDRRERLPPVGLGVDVGGDDAIAQQRVVALRVVQVDEVAARSRQGQFQSLDSVTKTQLATEFDIIQAEQQPEDSVRGIPVADLHPVLPVLPAVEGDAVEPTSPTTDAIPLLPTTPPRPHPPPKDGLMSPYSPSDFRMSRSMENFSRPTRLSVTASDVSPPSRSEARLSALASIPRTSVLGKPLPLLPDMVHAVSTRDDIALPLPTAPLPSPPTVLAGVPEEEERPADAPSSSPVLTNTPRSSRGNVKASRSPKHKRRSQSSGEIQFDAAFNNVMLMVKDKGRASTSATPDINDRTLKKRISIGVKPIEIEDWEDAIDYSWDHATDLEEVAEEPLGDSRLISQPTAPTSLDERYLIVEQATVEEASSSASTPLMMQAYPSTARQSSQASLATSLYKNDDEPASPLLGLGIASLPPVPTVSLSAKDTADGAGDAGQFESSYPTLSRTPNSTMSKSSSQESIILSIASSMIGTQRSSNSSTSLSDFAHLANFGDSMEKLDIRGSTSSIETRNRDGSQDTIREESQASPTTCTIPDHSDIFGNPAKKHDRVASASQITIPERKSSIPGFEGNNTQGGRKRANTATSRPRRNTRVSYSLFPSSGPN